MSLGVTVLLAAQHSTDIQDCWALGSRRLDGSKLFEVENVAKNLRYVFDSKKKVSKLIPSLFSTLVIIQKLAFRF